MPRRLRTISVDFRFPNRTEPIRGLPNNTPHLHDSRDQTNPQCCLCVFSWRFNLSGRVKTFPQISHTWRDLLVEEISSSSCKIIRCINDGFTIRFRDTVRQVLFARSCLKITSTIEQSLSSAWFYHSFIYTISCFCKTII